tara:strand:- start:332 stop:592 length:261 start_codon:yes stop_codon:yes gene_type:complete
MDKNISEYKRIFEDDSLTDLQKYNQISYLHNKVSIFWNVFIGLNLIVWPLFLFIPSLEIESSNSKSIVALSHRKKHTANAFFTKSS